ncbi:uncharacterized protein BDR25DRAFT_155748, partial [Lindgomyces ingoldianus]
GITWMLLAISFVCLIARLIIRSKTFSKLSWDDALVVFAWFMSLGTAITMKLTSKFMYQLEYVRVGILWPPPTSFMSDTEKYFKGTIAQGVLFYTGLWAVKFAFLIFFWRLVNKVQSLRVYWYAVLAFTVLSYAAVFAATDWRCIASPVHVIFERCGTSSAGRRMKFQMWFTAAVDVASDVSILTIPFVLLWQVSLPARKRLALGGIFSLVVVTMAVALLRASFITAYRGQPDNSRTTLWSFVEQSIAIIIVCLGSFRTLFTQEQPQ